MTLVKEDSLEDENMKERTTGHAITKLLTYLVGKGIQIMIMEMNVTRYPHLQRTHHT